MQVTRPREFSDVTRPRFAVNSYSTPNNSIYDDVAQAAAIGGAAVGLWERKFADGEDSRLEDLIADREPGAEAALDPRILPRSARHPQGPKARTELICASIERLGRFRPGDHRDRSRYDG